PPAGGVVPGGLVVGGRRRPPVADGGWSPMVGAGRRAVAVLSGPWAGARPRGGPARGSRRGADSIDPAQGVSSRPAGRGVLDALVAATRRAAVGPRPSGAERLEPGRDSPGHRGGRSRGCRPHRLRPPPPAGRLGLAGQDRRGPFPRPPQPRPPPLR